MKAFRFPLEKVMEWRRTQLEMEEAGFRKQLAAMAELDAENRRLLESGNAAERQVRDWNPVAGSELEALGSFRLHVKMKETELAIPRADCHKELMRRKNAMLDARRRLRLLERLKERRLQEWRVEEAHELDSLAAESYLSRYSRSARQERKAAPRGL